MVTRDTLTVQAIRDFDDALSQAASALAGETRRLAHRMSRVLEGLGGSIHRAMKSPTGVTSPAAILRMPSDKIQNAIR